MNHTKPRLEHLLPPECDVWRRDVCTPLRELAERAIHMLDEALGEAEVNRVYKRRFRDSQNYRGLAYEIIAGAGLAKVGRDLQPQVASAIRDASFDWRVCVSGVVVNCEVTLITDVESFPGKKLEPVLRYAYDPKARGNDYASHPRIPRGECADIQDKLAKKVSKQLPADGGPNVFVVFHESGQENNLLHVATALYGSYYHHNLLAGNWDILNTVVMPPDGDGVWRLKSFHHVGAVIGVSPKPDGTDVSLEIRGFLNPCATVPISKRVITEMMGAFAPEVWGGG